MLKRVFHAWERRLAAAAENRTVRPFEWGVEWIPELRSRQGEEASLLMDWAMATARARHAPALLLTVFEENPRAIAFYAKFGFVHVGAEAAAGVGGG